MAKRLQSILSQQSTYIRISIRCKLPGISSPATTTPPPTTRSYMLFLLPLVHCRRRLYYLTLRRGSLMCAAVIFKLNKYLPTNVLLQDSAALSQWLQSSSKLLVYYFHSMYICVAQGLNSDIISVCITYWQSYHATLHNTIPYFFLFHTLIKIMYVNLFFLYSNTFTCYRCTLFSASYYVCLYVLLGCLLDLEGQFVLLSITQIDRLQTLLNFRLQSCGFCGHNQPRASPAGRPPHSLTSLARPPRAVGAGRRVYYYRMKAIVEDPFSTTVPPDDTQFHTRNEARKT